MFKRWMQSHPWRRSLVLAMIVVLVLVAGVSAAIVIGGVTSSWSSATPGNVDCLAYDNGHGTAENLVRWGGNSFFGFIVCTLSDSEKSAYGFNGVDNIGTVTQDQDFLFGNFTHYNQPIAGTSIESAEVTMSASFCGVPKTFSYTFLHDETPNSADPCAYGPGSPDWPGGSGSPGEPGDTGPNRNGCADQVTLPDALSMATFDCDGLTYTLFLSSFIPTTGSCPSTPGSGTAGYLYSAEQANNVACVYGLVGSPLAVTLASLTADASGDGVTLAWETVSELDNAGFNVYRADSDAGPWAQLNAALIPAAAPGSSEGHAYSWTDAGVTPGASYWYALEDVDLGGSATRHAPVAVTIGQPNAVQMVGLGAGPALGMAAPLAALGLALASGYALARRRRR